MLTVARQYRQLLRDASLIGCSGPTQINGCDDPDFFIIGAALMSL